MPSDRARFLYFFLFCAAAQCITGAVAWSVVNFALPPMLVVAVVLLASLALAAHFSARYVEPRHFLRQVKHAIQTRQMRTQQSTLSARRSTPSEEAALVVAATAEEAAAPAAEPVKAPAVRPPIPPQIDERWASLTQREREVSMGVGEGLTNKEIAAKLVVTEYTIKKHLNNIFTKIGVRNRTELALFALEQEDDSQNQSEV